MYWLLLQYSTESVFMAVKRWILFALGLLIGVTLGVVGARLMSFETPLCAHVFCPYVPGVASTKPTSLGIRSHAPRCYYHGTLGVFGYVTIFREALFLPVLGPKPPSLTIATSA